MCTSVACTGARASGPHGAASRPSAQRAPRRRPRLGRRARHLLRNPDAGWADVPALPKAAVAVLDQHFVRSSSALEACQRSSDGTTAKLLVRLQDGLQVEAVIMTYSHPGAPASPVPHPPRGQAVLRRGGPLSVRGAQRGRPGGA